MAGQAHPQAASLISIRLRILKTGCRAPTKVCSYPCVSSVIKLTRASGPLNPFRSSGHCMSPVLSLVRAVHMLTRFPASVSRPRSEVVWGKWQCLFTMAESSCWHCPKSCRTEHLLRLHTISAKLTVWYRRSLNCIAPVCSQGLLILLSCCAAPSFGANYSINPVGIILWIVHAAGILSMAAF